MSTTNNEENFSTSETVEHIKQIVLIRIKLLKYEVGEKVAQTGASVVSSFAAYFMLFFCIVFASVAIAYGIAELTGHTYLGFAAMALFYLLVFVALKFIWARAFKRGLLNFFIKNIFEKNEG